MSTTHDLVAALKAELRAAGLIYAALATELGMSESSVKRVFAKGDMPLSRIDEILRVLKMDFAELARQVADAQPLRRQLNVHGGIMRAQATSLVERLQRVGQDFGQARLADQHLPDAQTANYTLLIGMRTWLFAAFKDLKRAKPVA